MDASLTVHDIAEKVELVENLWDAARRETEQVPVREGEVVN